MEKSSEDSEDERDSYSLLGKLKRKFKLRKDGKKSKSGPLSRPGNKNAARTTRRIQLGLKINGKHIRKESTGGGKRFAKMDKSLGKNAIIAKAKEYFFAEDNRFGPVDTYTFLLENFEEKSISESQNIAEMYECTGLPLLRFYLCATSKQSVTNDTQIYTFPDSDSENTGKEVIDCVFPGTRTVTDDKTEPVSSPEMQEVVIDDMASQLPLEIDEVPEILQFIDLGTPTVQARADFVGVGNTRSTDQTTASSPTVHDIFNYVDDEGIPMGSVASHTLESEVRNESKTAVKVKLHRGHLLKELTDFFKEKEVNEPLEIQMIMPNGKEEAGEDTGGVLRDALSEFWESFYMMNTTGDSVKVPCVRDTMMKQEWKACADILVMGYKQEGYFPHQLAKPFLEYTMDGDDTIISKDNDSLIPTFLLYVPESERHLLTAALENFDSVDNDDLIDVLDSYQVKRQVTAENLEDVVRDAAHRALVQGPAYISRCWHRVFVDKLKPIIRANISDICDQAVPTHKKVIDSIVLPDQPSEAERNTGKLLIKYIRSLSHDKLISFMRYTTGANLMIGRKITVRYVEQSDFARRPIAHTCGCVLELSHTYKDFIEFRSEFNSVLEAKVWVMDMYRHMMGT